MVIIMNKTNFINELAMQLSYSKEVCVTINDILESNFFLSKKNKDKIIEEFIQKLDVNNEEAAKIYDVAIEIVKDEIKNKLKHPFKNQD